LGEAAYTKTKKKKYLVNRKNARQGKIRWEEARRKRRGMVPQGGALNLLKGPHGCWEKKKRSTGEAGKKKVPSLSEKGKKKKGTWC